MDVSSSLSGPKEFRIVKRGYDPDEVDAFLDQIAFGVAELKRKLAEASDAAQSAPAGSAPAPAAASATADGRGDEIQRALILASRAADEELRKANEEAATIRAEAQAVADEARQRADAEVASERASLEEEIAQRRDEGRAGLLAEISELETVRDSLAGDVVVLERHVDEQREVVQAAIGELQSLLDHPEAFRIAMASGVSSVAPMPDPPPVAAAPADDADEADSAEASGPEPTAEATAPVTPQDLVAASQDDPAAPELPLGEADDAAPEPTEAADSDLADDAPSAGPGGAVESVDDPAPPTDAVAAVGDAEGEDAFLAELRKAMLDDEPLGPRDQGDDDLRLSDPDFDDDSGRGRSRFGRRK